MVKTTATATYRVVYFLVLLIPVAGAIVGAVFASRLWLLLLLLVWVVALLEAAYQLHLEGPATSSLKLSLKAAVIDKTSVRIEVTNNSQGRSFQAQIIDLKGLDLGPRGHNPWTIPWFGANGGEQGPGIAKGASRYLDFAHFDPDCLKGRLLQSRGNCMEWSFPIFTSTEARGWWRDATLSEQDFHFAATLELWCRELNTVQRFTVRIRADLNQITSVEVMPW